LIVPLIKTTLQGDYMKEHLNTDSCTVNWLQILIGAAGLLFGTLVYLVDSPPDQTYFVDNSSVDISLHNILPNLFGPIGNNLPAFIHVFSFILITAGLISCQKRGYFIICMCWFILDCAFELGQKYNIWSSRMIPDWFGGIPFLENSKYYFLKGTFDFTDLAAIALGTIMAYIVLLITNKIEKRWCHEKSKK
jgi:hypothetical protein